MKKSEKYQLNLPEGSDPYDVEHMNANTRIIEQKLKENDEHNANKNNPHVVTKTQVGLDNVDNTSDVNKPISTAQKQAIDNATVSGTATGTNLTIQDSTNAPLIYGKFKGYTEQQTYSGKNLSSAGNLTGTLDAFIPINHLVDGTTYTLSCVLSSTDTDSSSCIIYKRGSSGEKFLTNEIRNTRISLNFTKESGDTNIRIFAGSSYDFSIGDTVTISDIQIEEGTTATTYEPYVGGIASPNPDYPQEIKALDNVSVKTCGKNLVVNNLTTTTVNGVTFTVNEDGSITANGTATADASVTIWKHPKIEKGKSYILSGGSSDKKNIKLVVAWGGNNHTYTSKGNEVSFTVDGDVTATSITMTISSGETANNFTFYPMIRNADITDATYEPYTETVAEFDLTEPLYEGDYIEYRADGSGVLHRKMASVVINGKNGITEYYITTNGTFAVSKSGLGIYNIISHGTKVICDYLLNKTLSSMVSGEKGICNLNDAFIYINLTGSASTVDEAKAWLAENPITVVYELAEPTEIELTAEQLAQLKVLRTFEPITNIFSDSETTIQYYKANDNGRAVGGLQERVENIENTRAVRVNGNAKQIYGDGVEGSMEVSRFQLDEKTYLVDIKVTLTKIPETLSGNGPSIDLSLSDLGFDSEVSACESMCILSSYYPIITNGGNYCLGGGMCSTDNFGRGFYFSFLPHKNTKGSISSVNTSVLAGCMMIRLQ